MASLSAVEFVRFVGCRRRSLSSYTDKGVVGMGLCRVLRRSLGPEMLAGGSLVLVPDALSYLARLASAHWRNPHN